MSGRYALVIGIAKYKNLKELKNVVHDAEAIATILREKGGYDVTLYPELGLPQQQKLNAQKTVSVNDLVTEIKTFLLKTAKNSEALIYFAGHGLQISASFGESKGGLAVYESHSKDLNNIVLFEDLNKFFGQAIKEAHLSSLVILLDCCHAGQLFANCRFNELEQHEFRYGIFAACRGHQQAYESGGHGIFTKAILEGLEENHIHNKGIVTFSGLTNSVTLKLISDRNLSVEARGQEFIDNAHLGTQIQLVSRCQLSQGDPHQLLQVLLNLNYDDEEQEFRNYIRNNTRIGAFWMHGEDEEIHRLLIHRFWTRKIPFQGSPVKYGFVVKLGWTIEDIWNRMSKDIVGQGDGNPNSIADTLYQHWQQSTTVIALRRVDLLEPKVLGQFIEQLWNPLSQRVRENTSQHRLLLILTDRNSSVNCESANHCIKLQPRKIDNISLNNWINILENRKILEGLWQDSKSIEEFSQLLQVFNNQDDVNTQQVLDKICRCCGVEFMDFGKLFTI